MGLEGSIEVKRRTIEDVLDPGKGGGHKQKFGYVCQSFYKAAAVCPRDRKACLMTLGCHSRRALLMTLGPEVLCVCMFSILSLFPLVPVALLYYLLVSLQDDRLRFA